LPSTIGVVARANEARNRHSMVLPWRLAMFSLRPSPTITIDGSIRLSKSSE
jgi:hypothetical protein